MYHDSWIILYFATIAIVAIAPAIAGYLYRKGSSFPRAGSYSIRRTLRSIARDRAFDVTVDVVACYCRIALALEALREVSIIATIGNRPIRLLWWRIPEGSVYSMARAALLRFHRSTWGMVGAHPWLNRASDVKMTAHKIFEGVEFGFPYTTSIVVESDQLPWGADRFISNLTSIMGRESIWLVLLGFIPSQWGINPADGYSMKGRHGTRDNDRKATLRNADRGGLKVQESDDSSILVSMDWTGDTPRAFARWFLARVVVYASLARQTRSPRSKYVSWTSRVDAFNGRVRYSYNGNSERWQTDVIGEMIGRVYRVKSGKHEGKRVKVPGNVYRRLNGSNCWEAGKGLTTAPEGWTVDSYRTTCEDVKAEWSVDFPQWRPMIQARGLEYLEQ